MTRILCAAAMLLAVWGAPACAQSYTISGRVFEFVSDSSGRVNKSGLSGITVAVGSGNTVTGADGKFSISFVSNGTYRVTPIPPTQDFVFEPRFRDVTVKNGNISGLKFRTFAIQGRVFQRNDDGSKKPYAGIMVLLNNQARALTDSTGFYRINGLGKGSYQVLPVVSGVSFPTKTRVLPTVNVRGFSPNGHANFAGIIDGKPTSRGSTHTF